MSDETVRLEHTGFSTRSCASRPTASALRRMKQLTRAPQKKRRSQAAVYLMVRIGVCVLLFCAVLALKLSNDQTGAEALSSLSQALEDESAEPDRLGRLRFVQIPSIIEVFAPSAGPALPAAAEGWELIEDDTVLALSVGQNARVSSPCAGLVSGVGHDEDKGDFVTVKAEKEVEYRVYGLAEVAVEQGQPLTKNSILGRAAGQTLYIRVYKKASPENPLDYFDLGKMQ